MKTATQLPLFLILLTLLPLATGYSSFYDKFNSQHGSCGDLVKCKSNKCGHTTTTKSGVTSPAVPTTGAPGSQAPSSEAPSSEAPSSPEASSASPVPTEEESSSPAASSLATLVPSPPPGECICTPATDEPGVSSTAGASEGSEGTSEGGVSGGESEATTESSSATGGESEATTEGEGSGSEATSEAPGASGSTGGGGDSSDSTGVSDGTSDDGDDCGCVIYDCILIEVFVSWKVNLTVEQWSVWKEFIISIQEDILINSSLTEEQKVVACSNALQLFLEIHVDIKAVILFLDIGEWGQCIDFLSVSISINLEATVSVTVVGGNGDCELTAAIKEAIESEECGCEDSKADLEKLLDEINAIFSDSGSYNYQQACAAVWVKFEAFFEVHVSVKSYLLSVQIGSYGTVQSFLNVCKSYHVIVNLDVSIGGSSDSDCALLKAITEAANSEESGSQTKAQLIALHDKLQVIFESTTDLEVRLLNISDTCWSMFELESWEYSIVLSINITINGKTFCTLYDLIFCSGICKNHGCGNPNEGPGGVTGGTTVESGESSTSVAPSEGTSEAGVSTSEAPASTSESATSTTEVVPTTGGVSSTTEQPVSPTPGAPDCSKCGELIIVKPDNTTCLTYAIDFAMNYTWTLSQKTSFRSYSNQIKNACYSSSQSESQKFTNINTALTNFNKISGDKQFVFSVKLNITVSVTWGTIGDFKACLDKQ